MIYPVQERFWAKVDKNGPSTATLGQCWLWTASTDSKGYGCFNNGMKMVRAHQFSFIQTKGIIAEGLELDHLCRRRNCVNPDHLESITHRENVLRSRGPSALNAQKTSCPKGHAYDLLNTLSHKNGAIRRCRRCEQNRRNAAYWREYRRRRKAEGRPLP